MNNRNAMSPTIRVVTTLVVILLLLALLPMWPYSAGWGFYPSGGAGLLLIILLVLIVAGRV